MPLDDFVTIVSNAYHEVEAPFYDEVRSELLEMLVPVLDSFVSRTIASLPGDALRAVDAGCATGFASARLMNAATERPLRDEEIAVLVYVHTPPLRPEEWPGWTGGMDGDELGRSALSALTLIEFRSYGFLGPLENDRVPKVCQREAQRLAERFPDDGANFCALWRKPADVAA